MMRFPKFSKRWRFEKYSPTQPRDPAGTPTGGQWTSGGIAGWHTEIPGGASIGLEGQRGPGYYVALDRPFSPESGPVEQVLIDVRPDEILDPRGLLPGTDQSRSYASDRIAMDAVNAMTNDQVQAAGGNWRALQQELRRMGYVAEVGYIDSDIREHGRELVVWDISRVRRRNP